MEGAKVGLALRPRIMGLGVRGRQIMEMPVKDPKHGLMLQNRVSGLQKVFQEVRELSAVRWPALISSLRLGIKKCGCSSFYASACWLMIIESKVAWTFAVLTMAFAFYPYFCKAFNDYIIVWP